MRVFLNTLANSTTVFDIGNSTSLLNEMTIAAQITSNTGSTNTLEKRGAGQLTLSGASSYTANTLVTGGTLAIDNAGSTTARLASTTGITVNTGGTLLLTSSSGTSTDRLNDLATVNLAGGTLNLGGNSEGSAAANGVGALTLTASSILDFGTAGQDSSIIRFASIAGNQSLSDNIVLSITDYQTTGVDHLYFAGTATEFTSRYGQNEVSFNGIAGYGFTQIGSYYEITAVPEPSTWIGGGLILGLAGWSQRKRFGKRLAAEGVKVGGTSTTAMAYLVDNGSQPGGAIYNYGANTAGTGDRALGMVASGTNVAAFGIQIINNSGSLLTGYTLTFDQEQYRSANGLTGIPNTDVFAYGTTAGNVGATATNYLTSTALTTNTAGDLVSTYSQTVSTTLIVTPRSVTVMNLNVPVGDSFFLRWTDMNDVANDAGLAVDNFTFTATASGVPEPATWSTVGLFLGLTAWSQRKRVKRSWRQKRTLCQKVFIQAALIDKMRKRCIR